MYFFLSRMNERVIHERDAKTIPIRWNYFLGICFLLFVVFLPPVYSNPEKMKLANELMYPLEGIVDLIVSYDEEELTLFTTEGHFLVIKELMTDDKPRYHANVLITKESIHISEGSRPLFGANFHRHVEIYLPRTYMNNVEIRTTSGDIDVPDVELAFAKLHVASTSGTLSVGDVSANIVELADTSGRISCGKISASRIRLESKSGPISVESALSEGGPFTAHTTSGSFDFGAISADTIKIVTTSGRVRCGNLNGTVDYRTTSGSLNVTKASGAGIFESSSSGALNLSYEQVSGDLTIVNKNGDVNLSLPAGLSFIFEGDTKNGSVFTTFQKLHMNEGQIVKSIVGNNPEISVKIKTTNGNIRVKR